MEPHTTPQHPPAGKPAPPKPPRSKAPKQPKHATKARAKAPAKAEAKRSKGAAAADKSRPELDPGNLDAKASAVRLRAIYRLQGDVENKKATYEAASRVRRAAKAELEEALEALEKEVHEQRFGPGPLFNPDGSDAAGKPVRQLRAIGLDDHDTDD